MFRSLSLAAVLLSVAAGATPARAGDLGVVVSAHGRHGGVELRLGSRVRTSGVRAYPSRTCSYPARPEVRRVWIPGERRRVWVPPVTETRVDACGGVRTYTLVAGYWRWIEEPGHWVTREVRVVRAPSYGSIVAR